MAGFGGSSIASCAVRYAVCEQQTMNEPSCIPQPSIGAIVSARLISSAASVRR